MKLKDICKDFSSDKKCLVLAIIRLSQNAMIIQTNRHCKNAGWKRRCYDWRKKLVGLEIRIYSVLVNDNRQHKRAKGANKNVVSKISHNDLSNYLKKVLCQAYSFNFQSNQKNFLC